MKALNHLFVGTSILALILGGAAAQAQDKAPAASAPASAAPGAATQAVEEIVVTGTHIAGLAKNTTVAVDVISASDLRSRGSPSPIELMKSLPYISGGANGENNYGSQSLRYNGAANVNLRGLSNASTNGFDRTLVLFNGQRIAPFALTNLSQTDINTVPMAAVGRVETLKNGGSTAYGSDAIAGVVNFITTKTLNGLDVGADYQAVRGSGGNWNGHLNWGKVFDRGNVLLSLGYDHTSELPLTARSWTSQPLLTNPQVYTTNGNPGVYTVATAAAGQGANKSFLDPGCTALGGLQSPLNGPSGAPICYQSRAPYYNLVDITDRVQLYGELNYEIAENTKLHLDAWYGYTNIPSISTSPVSGAPQYYPTLADEGGAHVGVLPGSATYPAQATAYYIPASNPGLKDMLAKYTATQLGLTAAQYAFAQANGLNTGSGWQALGLGGNPATGGATKVSDSMRSVRVSGGLDGVVFNDINWTSRFTVGQYNVNNQYPDIITQRLELALRGLGGPSCNVAANTPGANGCMYFNPFSTGFPANGATGAANSGYVGNANDPALVAWMKDPNQFNSRSRLATAEGGLNGKLGFWTLPGGPISWAVGVQYRWNELMSDPQGQANYAIAPCTDAGAPASSCAGNPTSSPLAVFGNGNTLTVSQASTGEYVELHLPLLPNFELQLAGRHEADSAGNVTNDPKFALRWQAASWLAFRASRESTFHAPLPLQLDTANPAISAAAAGLTRVKLTTIGNPDLKPETSTNYDFGVIFTPRGLVATIDYWSYKINNQITTENLGTMVSALFPTALGQAGHCGDPSYAKLQAKFEFANGCGLNNIAAVTNSFINGPEINTSGVDFDISYKHDLWGGVVTLATNATRMINFTQADQYLTGTPLKILASYNQVGKYNGGGASNSIVTYGRPLPAWRDMTSINFAMGRQSVRWITHYVDGVVDNRFGFGGSVDPTTSLAGYPAGTSITTGAKIKSSFTHDISYSYTTKSDWQLTLAITNLFDKNPPFARTEISYAQDLGSPLGRVVRMGVQKTF
ncbi:MAG: TonB-dependent outer rane receptor [Caulobacteraceae bacterium]|nr:TonB-dependent outer rane receptor [Caulobacteraceae bacterium]